MNDDTIYAVKLVVFSILIGLGIIGLILRIKESRAPHKHKFEPDTSTAGITSRCSCGAEVPTERLK